MVGSKMQAFCPRIDMLKGNHCILRIRGAPVCQKLGMILENKVVQTLKLGFFYKKWSPKVIFILGPTIFKIPQRTDINVPGYNGNKS